MSDSSSSIIRTTAKYHEAGEPNRHKPQIRIDGTTTTHYIDAVDLANTVRASIDSGRDNPFRPDGEIYRSVDPIVDYYKYGPNQSRPQSPIESLKYKINGKSHLVEIEIGGNNNNVDENGNRMSRRDRKKLEKLERKKMKQKEIESGKCANNYNNNTSKQICAINGDNNNNNNKDDENLNKQLESKSCFQRWFCCACFGGKKSAKIIEIKSSPLLERDNNLNNVHNGKMQLRKKTNLEIGLEQQQQQQQQQQRKIYLKNQIDEKCINNNEEIPMNREEQQQQQCLKQSVEIKVPLATSASASPEQCARAKELNSTGQQQEQPTSLLSSLSPASDSDETSNSNRIMQNQEGIIVDNSKSINETTATTTTAKMNGRLDKTQQNNSIVSLQEFDNNEEQQRQQKSSIPSLNVEFVSNDVDLKSKCANDNNNKVKVVELH